MALILQNRSETELRENLNKLFKTLEEMHSIPIDYTLMTLFANQAIEQKTIKLLSEWIEAFSIPELMRIKKICVEAAQAIAQDKITEESKEESKPQLKVKKKHLQ